MNNDAKKIATGVLSDFTDSAIKGYIEERPWMTSVKFALLTKQVEVEKYIDACVEKGLCALDLETTGLNTRLNREGQPWDTIVGICLAVSSTDGVYIPVAHEDKEYNVPLVFIIRELKRLISNCRCIFHNFKYDGQMLRNYGIVMEDETAYEDTYLMAAVDDASRKEKGLKYLSEKLLDRPMLEIDQLGVSGEGERAFNMVPPPKALYYGASDAVCTFGLYEYFTASINEQDPGRKAGPWGIYKIEKRCMFATMCMERNFTRIDRNYLKEMRVEIQKRIEKSVAGIYELADRKFDLNSPKQIGQVLFDELKIKYPMDEKSSTGQYLTNEKVLEKLADTAPIVNMILAYRGFVKTLDTYVVNLLNNADWNDEVKFQMNQVQADTGRYSASGGRGLTEDGYCGVNCQNLPKFNEKDPNAFDLRRAIVGRPGTKIVTIDYSGEELRIATNFSREPKWLEEFLHGTADLHTITGKIIYNKDKIDGKERDVGKRLNFLTVYGGGAGGFSAVAKIPYETAKKMLVNFFREYKGLKKWIDEEMVRSRKRGYSKTALGRRRPLREFYVSPDKATQSKGDRCAVNSAIQGSGGDIIKVALYRAWKWIKDNGFDDEIRMLMPVHDEIVFEVKEDRLSFFIPELCDIMCLKDVTEKLQWPVPLDVDAEYGDSFHVDHDFWKEHKNDPTLKVSEKPEQKEDQKSTTQESAAPPPQAPQQADTVREAINGEEPRTESIKKVFETVEEKKEDLEQSAIFHDGKVADRIDKQGYFNYVLDVDFVKARQVKIVLETLTSYGKKTFVGPTSKVCLVNKEGEVWYKSTEPVSIDAFIGICIWLNV